MSVCIISSTTRNLAHLAQSYVKIFSARYSSADFWARLDVQTDFKNLNGHAFHRFILGLEICRAQIEIGQEEKINFSHRDKEGLRILT